MVKKISFFKHKGMLSPQLKDCGFGLIIVFVFIMYRLIFALRGGSFIAKSLSFAKQYLDPELLENDLLTSLFYQHSQPPLFNFFLGAILKLSPDPALSYELFFKIIGVLIPLIFFSILISFGIKRLIAFIATIVFMLNPTLILYENLLYYTYCEAFIILLAIFFLLRWGKQKRFLDLFLFWMSLLCLGMIRSLFHPVFFLIVGIIVGLYLRRALPGQRLAKTFLLTSLLALIPFFVLGLKNVLIFGFFGTSSWTGMSLWIKTNGYSPIELEELYSKNKISSYALRAELDPFQPIQNLLQEDELKNIPCHHPADCNEWRSTGKPNFNHSGYVYLSKQLLKDALSLIAYNPGLAAFYTMGSYSLTLWHSSDSVHALFEKNMAAIYKLEAIYRFLNFGFIDVSNKYGDMRIWTRTVIITLCFLCFYLATLVHVFRKKGLSLPAITIVCLFCFLIHFYAIAVSSLVEFGENNRFRFPVDAAFLILLWGNMAIWARQKNGLLRKLLLAH